jgi:hypothetical protein
MKILLNKNTLNIVLVTLALVVMGCQCGKLQELANSSSSTPSSSPSTSSSPSDSKSDSKPVEKAGLSLDKYNRLKNGMSYKEVVEIMGSDGVETMSSGEGKYKVTSYKWEGDDFQFVYTTFMGDKLSSKTQANLK